jgi:predicted helicase
MPNPIRTYLKQIEAALAAGNATEHTHRPALKALIEALAPGVTAINEPQRIACGAPDLVIQRADLTGSPNLSGLSTIGYVEAKDVGKSLDEAERTDQLARYRRALPNLILTDYLEFRWYVDGERRAVARLFPKTPSSGRSPTEPVTQLLNDFLAHQPAPIASPQLLAVRMARLAHLIRDIIAAAFEGGRASNLLTGWRQAFAQMLIADLDQPEKTGEFADMLAQTLAYGLFAARVMDTSAGFTRQEAQHLIPKTNPFLRDFFYQVTGPQMDDEPFAGFVDDLAALLAAADMNAILADFGVRTGQEDPVMHFYETFLAAYDPKLRETRGVYYTPTPVASYIVRSVDALLRTRFKCPQGLADSTQIEIDNPAPAPAGKGGGKPPKKIKVHKVLLLDPATGTATFPYAVIDHIRAGFMQSGNAGLWSSYVREHLLPRLFGFELLMAPYAVAHFKLGLQLAGLDLPDGQRKAWAYDFAGDERIGIYLTNTLEGPHEHTGLPLFTQFLARETDAANRIKQDLPVLVILGNPPYSGHSANKGPWMDGLLKGQLPDGMRTPSYYELDGQPLGERNSKWLQDDYVKFIRWAQWRIERTGSGVLAFITNHSYLDNPTFRGMRRALMNAFSDIYILDLHGNAKKREVAPDGGVDENVFDIQQGVAIGIFVKEPGKVGPAQVHHAELWGRRPDKYTWLQENGLETTPWQTLNPQTPFYLFVPQNTDLWGEYQQGWKVTDVFPVNSVGIVTGRDSFVFDHADVSLIQRVQAFLDSSLTDDQARERYLSQGDKLSVAEVRRTLKTRDWQHAITSCLYRPFDARSLLYMPEVIERSRSEVMRHLLADGNLGLITARSNKSAVMDHFFVTRTLMETKCGESTTQSCVLPLYCVTHAGQDLHQQRQLTNVAPWPPDARGRVPNLAPAFVAEVEARLGMKFAWPPLGDSKSPLPSRSLPTQAESVANESAQADFATVAAVSNRQATFTPEDLFDYIYAVFHAPTYRARYAEFLKIDFPRVPITSDVDLFWRLAALGRELVALHLLDADAAPALLKPITRFPVAGDGLVEKGHPRYTEATRRVYISADNVKTGKQGQYIADVPPEVWDFQVGGYQPCQKWLKDRAGRQLTYDDLTHYSRIVVSLKETIRLMGEIDAMIPAWPIQ